MSDELKIVSAALIEHDERIEKLETGFVPQVLAALPAAAAEAVGKVSESRLLELAETKRVEVAREFTALVDHARAELLKDAQDRHAAALAAIGERATETREKIAAEFIRAEIELAKAADARILQLFAELPAPEAGPRGPGFVWRGRWNAETEYAAQDVVASRGASWIATRPNRDVAPRDEPDGPWDLMASAGANGANGEGGTVTGLQASDIADDSELATPNVAAALTFLSEELLGMRRTYVISASTTASLNVLHIITATATLTDPTPSEGATFEALIVNGTGTVGGTAYASVGTLISRTYHSGSWRSHVIGNLGITAGSSAISFAAPARQTLTVSGTLNFTGTDYTAGNSVVLYLTASGGPHTINLASGWVPQGPIPSTIAAGKQATMLLDCITASASGVRVFYTEQP